MNWEGGVRGLFKALYQH